MAENVDNVARHRFVPPEIQDNRNGWGPCTVPEQFRDMPYQPFSKSDRIGKVNSVPNLSEKFILLTISGC